ncbi:hypothetical protein MLD38_001317 [Melastoma candidum]|uniref:Uncharacterized protein n=1 Tax=Melastoma candidum TaxID=119954 RepID=A0ACB9SCX4_9MYRT|nr:hypothetical protein MLD38_001317 [Melastoma candidum]
MRPSPANPVSRNRRSALPTHPSCPRRLSRSAAVDFLALVAVFSATGFLLFPCVKTLGVRSARVAFAVAAMIGEEVREAPLVYASMGMSVLCAGFATFVLVSSSFKGRKCLNPECRGLRKSVEFDIQLETEEDSRKAGSSQVKNLFELPMFQHKELEAELRRIAPPNGRAMLVFRARCGCPIGRFEVPGPKRPPPRKTQK